MRILKTVPIIALLMAIVCGLGLLPTQASGALYYYSGDTNDVDGLGNVNNGGLGTGARVYNTFTVTEAMGVTVTGLFTNNAMDYPDVGLGLNQAYSLRVAV